MTPHTTLNRTTEGFTMKRAPNHPVLVGSAVAALAITVFAIAGPLSPPAGPVASTSPSLADLELAVATSTAGPADTSSTPGSATDGKPLSLGDSPQVTVVLEVNGLLTGFWHVSDLARSIEVIEYRDGADPGNAVALPGNNYLPGLTLIRPLSEDKSAFEWFNMVVQGDIASARQDATLLMFSADGTLLAEWSLTQAWPTACDVRCDSDACAEQLTITMDNLVRLN
jgi:phage tail-like protein